MIVGDPLEELLGLVEAGLVERKIEGRQLVGDLEHFRLHLRPVRDRRAHVLDRRCNVLAQCLYLIGVADPLDLEQHDRLGRAAAALFVAEGQDMAARITLDTEDRMDDRVRGETRLVDCHRDRVDQERHVIGGDRNHGVTAVEAFLGGLRIEDPDLRRMRRALAQVLEHVLGDPCPFGRIPPADVVGRHVAEEVGSKSLRIALAGGTALAGNLVQDRLETLGFAGNALGIHSDSSGSVAVGAEDTLHPMRNPPRRGLASLRARNGPACASTARAEFPLPPAAGSTRRLGRPCRCLELALHRHGRVIPER